MRRVILAAAVAAIALTAAACNGKSSPELRDAMYLKAVPLPGHKLTGEDIDSSVEIMQRRLDKLGVEGKVRRADHALVIGLSAKEAEGVPEAVTTSGLLEFYDFEAALQPPSVTRGLVRAPIAMPKPPQAPIGTVVVSCKVASGACLSTRPLTAREVFYLFNSSPAMTERDLEPSSVRADADPSTGRAVVYMQFTERGKRSFREITRREAERGALVCADQRESAAVQRCAQHFAIVLDHELVSAPYIDFVRNPDGIPADNGAQIELDSPAEAKRIAVALQTGALPVRLVRLP